MSSIFGTANQVLTGSRYDQNLNLKKKKKKKPLGFRSVAKTLPMISIFPYNFDINFSI